MTADTAEATTSANTRRPHPGRRRPGSADTAPSTCQPQPAPPESDAPWPETVANPRRTRVR